MSTVASDSQNIISIRDVYKRFGTGVVALEGVDLDICQGEFLSLVGPSGCGKSTLLRLIAGLGESSSGTVEVMDQSPEQARRSTGELALVFQDSTLMPWRKVIRNVELPLEMRGVDKKSRRQKAQAALEMVNLHDAGRLYPRQLSGGMKMRASVARALVSEPKVLLMDEPFGALDELTRQKLQQDLLEIWRETGLTVIFVTHNSFEAVFLSQRVAVMGANPGRMHRVLDVDAPYPRTEEFRSSEEFGHLVAEMSRALRGE